MARKSSAALKSQPVKLGKISNDAIAHAKGLVVPPGAERQHQSYIDAVIALEQADARAQVLSDKVDKMGSNDPDWQNFNVALHELDKARSRCFRTYDGLAYLIKHADDAVLPGEDEIRAITGDSLSDKLDELAFTVNYGLLASKITLAIRKDAADGFEVEAPMCGDCQ